MQYHWKYIKGRDGEYPEVYILYTEGNRIKVEANTDKRKVRIYIETVNGNIVQSSIANGIVLEEKDILGNLESPIGDEICLLNKELSSIPDSKILRIINGKYGILTEFYGKITRRSNQDVQTIKKIALEILHYPGKIYRKLADLFYDMLQRPSVWDIVDMGVVSSLGYMAYMQNFNYALGGVVGVAGAVLSGSTDWLIRGRSPYLIKILLMLIPAAYVLRFGLVHQ